MKFKDMQLKNKIMFPVTLFIVVVVLASIVFIMTRVSFLLTDSAEDLAQDMGYRYGNEMRVDIERTMEAARIFAATLEGMKKGDEIPDRERVTALMKTVLEDNEHLFGIWTIWEPDAFDGRDAEFVNRPGHDATGRFVAYWNHVGGLHLEPCVEYVGEGTYYDIPMKSGREYLTEPTAYAIGGQEVMVVSAVVPVRVGGRTVGVVGTDISMERFAALVGGMKPFETGYGFLISHGGLVVGHPRADLVGGNFSEAVPEEHFTRLNRAVQTGEEYRFVRESGDGRGEMTVFFTPITLGKTGMPWSLGVAIPHDRVTRGARTITQVTLVLTVVAVFVLVVMIFLLVQRTVVRPIKAISDELHEISAGEADLTKRLEIASADEIGQLAGNFNAFVTKLEEVVTVVKKGAAQVTTATDEVSCGTQGLAQSSQEQASAVEEVAATIEEMTSSIKLNAENAAAGREKGQSAQTVVETNVRMAGELTTAMQEINEASRHIGDIVDTVNEVAFQTNLLALNAAVEAARAGEQGKGFAVVASEVRALAGRSADAAREIRVLIEDTVGKIHHGDELVQRSQEMLTSIDEQVAMLAQTMEEVAAASGEQSTGIDELNRAIAQIDGTTQQNASTVEELAGTAESLKTESGALSQTVALFTVAHDQDPVGRRDAPPAPQRHSPAAPQRPAAVVDDGFEEF